MELGRRCRDWRVFRRGFVEYEEGIPLMKIAIAENLNSYYADLYRNFESYNFFGSDYLGGAGRLVVACESKFYDVLGTISGNDLLGIWKEGLPTESGHVLWTWVSRNYLLGQFHILD